MKKTRTFKVVMLPASRSQYQVEKDKLFINDSREHSWGKLEALVCERVTTHGHAWNGTGIKTYINHLYIISDDEIKEGDWYVTEIPQMIFQYYETKGLSSSRGICKKIVATTDISLKVTDLISDKYAVYVPQLPESFIQAYIKTYNEGKPIIEVDLEMEEYTDGNGMFRSKRLFQPRTRPDNTVIVHQSKMYSQAEYDKLLEKIGELELTMYSRDEVKIKCNQILNDYIKDQIIKGVKMPYDTFNSEKWLDENL